MLPSREVDQGLIRYSHAVDWVRLVKVHQLEGDGYDVKGGSVVNLGFTGAAQAGYSTNVQVGFGFHQNGYLCGNNAPPPYAGLYVAHA